MNNESDNVFSRIAKNAGILTLGQCVEKVINFALFLLLWRYLGERKEVFGQYGFVSSYVLLFGAFAGLGFSVLCTREMARKPEQSSLILTAALAPMLLSSLMTLMVIVTSVYVTKPGQTAVVAAVFIMGIDLILNNLAGLFDAIPRSRERMFYSVVPSLLKSSMLLLLYLVFLHRGLSLVEVCSLIMFASMARLALQVFFGRVVFRVGPASTLDRSLARRLFMDSYPMALTSMFIVIYYKIDSVMLSYMRGDEAVALYTVASTLAFALLFLATNFQQAVYPALTKLLVNSPEQMVKVYRLCLKYLAMLGFPVAAGLAILASRIILLWRPDYVAAAIPFRILTVALFLMFINGLMGYALITVNGQKVFMRIVGVGALLNVLLNLAVIPRYGIIGAALATVLAESFAACACWLFLSRKHGLTGSLFELLRLGLCCAGMSLVAVACYSMPLIAIIAASAVAYVILLFVSKAVGSEDFVLIKGLFLRRD